MPRLVSGVHTCLTGTQAVAPVYSSRKLTQPVRSFNSPEIPFYSVCRYDPTLPFSLGRTLILADFKRELAFGIRQAPDGRLPDLAAFVNRWEANQEALAVMSHKFFAALQRQGLKMQEIARNADRVVVKKP